MFNIKKGKGLGNFIKELIFKFQQFTNKHSESKVENQKFYLAEIT